MTTRTYSSIIDQTSDAGFRAWGSEFASNIQTAGLVQTADTGQINWTTVTRAGGQTDAGFEIYKLNDSLFATAPIYIRIGYGSGNSNIVPRITIQVGTATNGAGTITGGTGILNLITPIAGNYTLNSTVTSYVTYICVKEGFFGFVFKAGAFTNSAGGTGSGSQSPVCLVARSCDTTGAITTTGFQVIFSNNGANNGVIRFYEQSVRSAATASVQAISQNLSIVPGSVSTSLTAGGNIQVYTHWMHILDIKPSIMSCTYVLADISQFTSFSTTLFGSTPHTYLSLGLAGGYGDVSNNAAYGIAMIWE